MSALHEPRSGFEVRLICQRVRGECRLHLRQVSEPRERIRLNGDVGIDVGIDVGNLNNLSPLSDRPTMSIAAQAKTAANLFEEWREKSANNPTNLEHVENQLFRFNLWTSNNYVLESSRASMDWRLRNAPLLQSTMDDLLDDLIMSLAGNIIFLQVCVTVDFMCS